MARATWPPDDLTLNRAPAEVSPPSHGRHAGTPTKDKKHALRLDIQGLRALAVSLVVLSHAGVRHFQGGYIGVDIFFVISGFLITSLLLRELSTTNRISITKFYGRRMLRLLPASTIVVVATLAGSWLYLSKIRFAEYVTDAVTSTFYAVNFRLAISGTNYLNATDPPSPFQHFWSLAVEEQFYLVWPLLLLVSWQLAKLRRGLLVLPLLALCAVSFALNISLTTSSPSWAYFGSQTRMWELGVGSLLALFVTRLERMPRWIAGPMSWIGLISIVVAALRFDNDTTFPGYYALVPVLGAAFILAGGASSGELGAELVLGQKPAVWLGGLSYSWYLWHWPLLVILPMALHEHQDAKHGLVYCVVALGLAWLTLHLVENPIRFHNMFRGRPKRALSLGVSLSAGAAVIALVAGQFPPQIGSSAAAPVINSAIAGAPSPEVRLTQLLSAANTSLPKNLSPALDKIKGMESAIYHDGCHAGYTSEATPPCVYGDTSSKKLVVLFGDSHAAQWFDAVNQLALQNHWKLISLTKASCKVANVPILIGGKPYTSCDRWRSKVLNKIVALHPALVIASSSDTALPVNPSKDRLKQWTDGFTDTYRTLRKSGAQVAAIADTPWPHGDAVDCASAHPTKLSLCSSDKKRAIQDPMKKTAIADAAKATGSKVIDPEAWLCAPSGKCPVVVGNTFVYRDNSHMTDAFAVALTPVLGDKLTSLFGKDLNNKPGH